MTFEEYTEVLTQDEREEIINDVVAEVYGNLPKEIKQNEN